MAEAARDQNRVETLLGVSSSDGVTTIRVGADPTTHALYIHDGMTGSDLGPTNDKHDDNYVPALMAVSSADGVTPVVVYAEAATGKLLVDSN